MNNYYITFGSEGQPFKDGWIIIEVETIEQACKIFRAMYQYKETNDTLLKFYSIYTEEGFKQTEMYKDNDNLGAGCHCKISIKKRDRMRCNSKRSKSESIDNISMLVF